MAALALSILLLCLAAPTAARQFGDSALALFDHGPLPIRDRILLGTGFLTAEPISTDLLDPGRWQVDVMATLTNTFASSDALERELEVSSSRSAVGLEQLRSLGGGDGLFHADGELLRGTIAVRRGLGRRVQIEAVASILDFQGGILDGAIEWFHDRFGFDQEGRDRVPRGALVAYARSREAEVFVERNGGVVLGDTTLGAKIRLPAAGGDKLALRLLVKLPTGDDRHLASSGSVDLAAQVAHTRVLPRSRVHLNASIVHLGRHETLGISPQFVLEATAAYERQLGPRTVGVAQVTVAESPFDELGLDELARATIQTTLGVKLRLDPRSALVIGLTENLGSFDNSADVGLHLGLTATLD